MELVIPNEIVKATHMSPEELRVEIAVMLFQKEWLTFGQASRFAEISQREFMKLLGSRKIPLHYGVEDFEHDLRTLEEQRRKHA